RDPQYDGVIFGLDSTGTILFLIHKGGRTTWLKLPGREWITDMEVWPPALAPGGNRWFAYVGHHATRTSELHYFPDGQKGPEIAFAEQGDVPGFLTFGPDGRHAVWGGSDHAVVLSDLTELQRAMAEFGLGW